MVTSLSVSSHDRPLAEAIAAATRPVHAKLNKLIITRLPLTLPPRANDPAAYVSGLLHVAPIYITFEALWQNILDAPRAADPEGGITDGCEPRIPLQEPGRILFPEHQDPTIHRPLVCDRIHSLLRHMHLPGLMRSDRLRADIRDLTGWPNHVVEDQLRTIGQMGRLGEFISHVKRIVDNKPHVLLAYSYILFMALFAGGRFIRASLESVGEDFWDRIPSPVKPTMHACERNNSSRVQESTDRSANQAASASDHREQRGHGMPLQFFHFPTPLDGEDLKQEFKKRLADSEEILTAREKYDIVQEAICIFDNMTLMVHQLDMVCAPPDQAGDINDVDSTLPSPLRNPLSFRLRDSVAVAKERGARSASKKSSSSEESICTIIKSHGKAQSTSTSSTNGNSPLFGSRSEDHPLVPSMSAVELCPGLSKSMRFDAALAQPSRSQRVSRDAGGDLAESLKMASKSVPSVRIVNWLMLATFGAVVVGALLTGRRGVMEA